ncbi:hypothetical protein ACVS2C_003182 [Vibrio parahaemolyticus]|uniref:hypothetical protein n=1 Tax=Vibrio sp. ES.051 TaxID=1761909 RepID=UPI00211D5C73|nr:hypothetical protein [Vibrio sp. ES.051]
MSSSQCGMEVFTQALPERSGFAFANALEVTFSGDKAYQLLSSFGQSACNMLG